MNLKEIGNQIKTIRKSQGLSQEALRDLSNVNLVTISKVENGRGNYSLKTLHQLVTALGCTFRVVIEKV